MISLEQVTKHIEGLSIDELKTFAVRRIRGEDVIPLGSGYFSEQPEEAIIQLLLNEEFDRESRQTIIDACKIIYSESFAKLAVDDYDGLDHFLRLCLIVDATAPSELRRLAHSAMTLVWDNYKVPSSIRAEALGAAMGYEYSSADIPLWEKVLNTPEFAAYGFTVLLRIDPMSPKIIKYLVQLWERQLQRSWKVDTAFLMRRAYIELNTRMNRSGDDLIQSVLKYIEDNYSLDEFHLIEMRTILLSKEWSSVWVREYEMTGGFRSLTSQEPETVQIRLSN